MEVPTQEELMTENNKTGKLNFGQITDLDPLLKMETPKHSNKNPFLKTVEENQDESEMLNKL